MLTETEKSYIAGFLDGEGCFAIYRNKGSFQSSLQVSNTNLDILKWLQSLYGGTVVAVKKRSINHRQAYSWRIVSNDCMRAITDLSPYLREKKEQADLMSIFTSGPRKDGEELSQRMKEIKHA